MSIHLCESPRCWRDPDTGTLQPHPAAPGLRLCWFCRDRLADDLGRLVDICTDLADALGKTGRGAGGPVVSGSRERALPLNLAAAYARTEVQPVLLAWTALVAERRAVRPPRNGDPAVLAFWLARHVDWLAAYPAAGDVVDEIADARQIAYRGAYPNPVRRIELGGCPISKCAGTVSAIVRDPSAVLPSSALCDADPGHEWGMSQWPRLRRAMRQAEALAARGTA